VTGRWRPRLKIPLSVKECGIFYDSMAKSFYPSLIMWLKAFLMCVMDAERKCLLADLEAIAASIQDPAKREGVRRIIARLAHQDQEWPDDAEIMIIRIKYDDRAY
jgi:hypothetical protein